MEAGFTTAVYVVAAILFILSLGGLSGQESAKRAVWYGIFGMGLAVLATLIGPGHYNWLMSIILIASGGLIGYVVAKRVQMTEMPQLVAAMHSLVGLVAVFVGVNAQIELASIAALRDAGDQAALDALTGFAKKLAQKDAVELQILKVEVFLGVFIGAVTFTGSVIAFGKLAGRVTSAAKKLPGGHLLNAGAAAGSLGLMIMFLMAPAGTGMWMLIAMTLLAFFIGYHLIMGIGGADM
ncbi:MAG: NAD(P)(+) transhydrogenase (Re/Si-specific) subunit beta, partial [Proteobacteria bacterium]|nr:NAD(P)(+) transhydrogenase (Re/Si-specific) subunit beta [Pseudomonadota bacterium]